VVCEHQGSALSLILEEKLTLGLSAPPPERIPIESLSDEALVKEALADRTQRAQTEKNEAPIPRSEHLMDRLYPYQSGFRQKLSHRPAGLGIGSVILFVFGFS